MDELTFNEGNHTYIYKGAILPSVTQIMRPLSDEVYKHIDPEVLRFAAERGTKVHFATEMWDLYQAEDISEDLKGYFNAYIKFLVEKNPAIMYVEKKSYHKQLMYAGTIDRLVSLNGEIVLIDYKTTNDLHPDLVAVQVSAYREILVSHGEQVDRIAVLQLKKDGTYDFRYLDDKFDIFMSLYKIHMFKKTMK